MAAWLLAFYGFKANIAQTPSVVFGIRMMVSLLPAAASIITAGVALLYGLNATMEKTIAVELKQRRAEADAAAAN